MKNKMYPNYLKFEVDLYKGADYIIHLELFVKLIRRMRHMYNIQSIKGKFNYIHICQVILRMNHKAKLYRLFGASELECYDHL